MKAYEVLNLLRVSRPTLTNYVKQGIINVIKLPNGRYDYDEKTVYDFMNKDIPRKNILYARVSTSYCIAMRCQCIHGDEKNL